MADNIKKAVFSDDSVQLEVKHQKVSVGNTYPIFGMITGIKDETLGSVIAEINHHITAKLKVDTQESLNVIKQKVFETGIFVSTILAIEPELEVDCKAVIFGKNQAHWV